MGYLERVSVLIQTTASLAEVAATLATFDGKVTGTSIQKMARAELPLARVGELNHLALATKVRFEGDHSDFFGRSPDAGSKLDEFLTELVDYLEATPVIVQTTDGMTAEDETMIAGFGGKINDNLSIINAYSASVPLRSMSELAASGRVKVISYNRKLVPD